MSKHEYVKAKDLEDYRCLMGEIPVEHMGFSLKEVIDSHLMKKQAERKRESSGWIHPSSLSICQRQVYYNAIEGVPCSERRSPVDIKLSEIGHSTHDKLQAWALEALGAEEFEVEKSLRIKGLNLSMRVDGVLVKKDWVLEIKSLGESGYRNLRKPRPSDLLQVHCYMFVTDIPRTILYYYNRNTGEDCEFKVTFDPGIWEKVLVILSDIDRHFEAGTKPDRLTSTFWCRGCRYNEHCMADK